MSALPAAPAEPETSGLREHLGIRFVGMEGESVVLELCMGPQHLNLASTLHGGAIATLIDIACALAARTPPGPPNADAMASPGPYRGVATLSLALHFTRPVREGRVRAVGRRMAGGRRVVFASADVFDDKGRLVANGSGSFAVMG
ncbi:PaaI family thioesterase [uncultured Hydrogenophaga sp.]|uniref:PaaI family thioesterase n=1 Tax=uncultured Hydrogenophaga sp. TaxID=199683 RepID=UPI0025828253|nr:PaaI family thioesterase [uncultured Hydrogenophaga sp.]